jgi:hypothetical protein
VEEGIAPFEFRVQLHHGAGHEISAAQMVDRQGFRPTEEFAVPGDDAGGKVPGQIENA